MTLGNSVIFIGFGLVMILLPECVPDYFPPGEWGASTSALWLQSMGSVQAVIGGCGTLRRLGPALRRWSALTGSGRAGSLALEAGAAASVAAGRLCGSGRSAESLGDPGDAVVEIG